MRKNKHLLLWSSLATLGLLVVAAAEENVFKDWRRIQLAAAEPIDVHLRQIVVPGLRTADRCTTCHVGMAAGEPRVAGDVALRPHPDVGHDVNHFGCTVCHGGQGRATEKDDAHGLVAHWPQPMLPARYLEAGCGSCHTHLAVTNLDLLHAGQAAFERNDCLACHKLDGRGGTLRPLGAQGMEGPDLSRVGAAGYRADWYERHLQARAAASDGPWVSSFGPIDDADRSAIEILLASRVGAPRLVEAKALFHSQGCRGCHKVGGVGGDDGPDLTLAGMRDPGQTDFTHVRGDRSLASWFAEHFRNPAAVVPGSQMPILGLTEDQIDLLTLYTLSLRQSAFPEAYWPKDRIRVERFGERAFATDGATLYGAFCAACHGGRGEGMRYPGMTSFPAIANPDFLAAASDDFVRESIRRGRPGRRMPAWGEKEGGLKPDEIDAIVAHLRVLGGVAATESAPQRQPGSGDASEGRQLYTAHCAQCHPLDGQGGEGPSLTNAVLLETATDDYLFTTIRTGRRGTTMQGFGLPSLVRPALADSEIESLVTYLRSLEKRP